MQNYTSSFDEVPSTSEKIKILNFSNNKNTKEFLFENEDATMGEILVYKLENHKNVLFCGYKKLHPLDNNIFLKIKTNSFTDPVLELEWAIKEIYVDLSYIQTNLEFSS
ncbi:dna directed RNA polymerase II 13.6 kDa chain (nucleomorph) [Guillardia theta]|uniref:Dna directed RNA polymerase II 13.6 kDa chain n=1 Tax=Guillardia theta TaxID=55529 RepID=Q98SA6_GUITH|nr:dna directed RNA polymerase II 13.6 kDa chain [Guillardia theta]AAK39677.1 dna directed RNA polymerase II 13.6 kDa chain [Guillardia theta]